jgi:hypothetical protein
MMSILTSAGVESVIVQLIFVVVVEAVDLL